MSKPSMLYIQENDSLNTARIVRVTTLPEALDALLNIYAQIKYKKEGQEGIFFDLEEALEYYQLAHELRYYEEMQTEIVTEKVFGNYHMKNVKVLNKKNLLDELVDHLVTRANAKIEMIALQ